MAVPALRIVFAGTSDFAAAHLQSLLEAGFDVVAVYSQPDRPSGRGKKLLATPVKAVAAAYGLPVYQPTQFGDDVELGRLRDCRADVMVVVAYGLLLPPSVLALPRYGCLNVHASLLPRWRGAAPIERALLAGDRESGICIMQMEAGLDTGPVLQRVATSISLEDNAASLTARLQHLGCASLRDVLLALPTGALQAKAQETIGVTYARKLGKEDSQIDWQRSALDIHNQIRALFPRAPAWCLHAGGRLRLTRARLGSGRATAVTTPGTLLDVSSAALRVCCGDGGILDVLDVQTEGKPAMGVASLLNGHPHYFDVGQVLHNAAPPSERQASPG